MVALVASAAIAQENRVPAPVAERVLEVRGHVSRVTLFDNRLAVVSMRAPGAEPEIHTLRLSEAEYEDWVEILERSMRGAEVEIESSVTAEDAVIRLQVHVGPDPPYTFEMPPAAGVDRYLRQILDVVDLIERQVLEAPEWYEEVSAWRPRVGDRVRLARGTLGTVIELEEKGVVVVEHDHTAVREVIPADARLTVIVDILDPEPEQR
jgi:hypothetical protein